MLSMLLLTVMMHPVHETVSELEWNPDSRRLEVAMRLDLLDEQWLRRRLSESQRAGGEAKPAKWELNYLKKHFRVAETPKKPDPDPTRYHWIGRDEEGGHVWWYFEIEPSDGKIPTWIEQRVLFDRNENHANRVVILGQVPKRTLILTMQRPKASLNQAEDDERDETPKTGRRSRFDR